MRTVHVETSFGSFESFESDHITEHLVEFGAYQRSDLAMLLSFVRPGDCVLDIGAHIGSFTVPLGKAVGEAGRVVAFEPVADHFELLERNIAGNNLGGVVRAVRAVVASGEHPLHLVRMEGNSGGTSFSRDEGESVDDVPVVSLDRWWTSWAAHPSSVAVIKIDVEGMEHEVLASGAEMIDTFRPVVHFEVDLNRGPPLAALDNFFTSRGYRFFVNHRFRDSSTDAFRLGRLTHIEHLSRAFPYIYDVVAVDPASPRWPDRSESAFATEAHLIRRAARSRVGRLRRSVVGRIERRRAGRP